MKAFQLQETSDGYFYFAFIDDRFNTHSDFHFTSSYHVLAARLLGMDYIDYLTYCQSEGAKIRGRGGYAHPIWKDRTKAEKVMKLIDTQWNQVIKSISFS